MVTLTVVDFVLVVSVGVVIVVVTIVVIVTVVCNVVGVVATVWTDTIVMVIVVIKVVMTDRVDCGLTGHEFLKQPVVAPQMCICLANSKTFEQVRVILNLLIHHPSPP